MKKKIWKQVLTFALAGTMVMGVLPTTAFGEDIYDEEVTTLSEEPVDLENENVLEEVVEEIDELDPYLTDEVFVGYELDGEEWTEEAEKNFLKGLYEEMPTLTIDDVPEEMQSSVAGNSGVATVKSTVLGVDTNPATYFTTTDNQNNAGTGDSDGDLDATIRNTYANHPIEADVIVDKIPTENAFLAVRTYDVDWTYGEYDMLFFNGYAIQPLTGLNCQWNTSYYEIPISYIKEGNNTVRVEVDHLSDTSKFYEDYATLKADGYLTGSSCWIVAVDWMQLICDGGSQEGIEEYSLTITSASNTSSTTYVAAEVVINQENGATDEYYTEYSITDVNGNIVGSYQGSKAVSGNENVTIGMPLSSSSGTYYIDGLLKRESGEVVATAKTSFQFEKNAGVVFAAPSISASASTTAITNEDVIITIKRTDSNTASVEATVTCDGTTVLEENETEATYKVEENGTYTFTTKYVAGEEDKTFDISVKVSNIDKEAPKISYTKAYLFELDSTTNEPWSDSEIEEQLQAYLLATDNIGFAGGMADITVDLTANNGFVAKVTDTAGNTTTLTDTYTTIYSPFDMTLAEPTESSEEGEYDFLAKIISSGGYDIVETGFVWNNRSGATVTWNLGQTVSTTNGYEASGEQFAETSFDIQDGVTYFVRAYAKYGSTVVYSNEQSFGTGAKPGKFAVTNNDDNTFSITLTEAETFPQIVSYRTTNGSAVGGTHFTHTSGTLIFDEIGTQKVIVYGEDPYAIYDGQTQTAYTIEGTGRTYGLEIYQSINGATLTTNSATRTMATGSTVPTTMYDAVTQNPVLVGVRTINTTDFNGNNTIDTGYPQVFNPTLEAVSNAYLKEVYDGWLGELQMEAASIDTSRYQYTRLALGKTTLSGFGTDVEANKGTLDLSGTEFYSNRISSNSDFTAFTFPYIVEGNIVNTSEFGVWQNTEYMRNTHSGGNHDGSSSTYGADMFIPKAYSQLTVGFGAYSGETWQVQNVYFNTTVYDETEPQAIGIAPMAETTYRVDDSIVVAVVFDEIIKSAGSISIQTNMTGSQNLVCIGGENTNVLYFKGTVETAESTLRVTNVSGATTVTDYYNNTDTSKLTYTEDSVSGSVDISTGTLGASVTVTTPTNDGSTAEATITGTNTRLIQYQWSTDSTMPNSDWINTTDTKISTSVQRSGTAKETLYLHVYGVGDSGSEYKSVSVTFAEITTGGDGEDDYIAPGTPPSLLATAINTNWAKERTITLEYSPSSSTITVTTPDGFSEEVTGYSYIAKENGMYTFDLEHTDGTARAYVVVEKIDTTAPTVSINESNTSAIYNTLTLSATVSDGESGVSAVSYAFTNSTAEPSVWMQALESSISGLYSFTYNATETTTSSIYLHVKATDVASNASGIETSYVYSVVKAPDDTSAENPDMPAVTLLAEEMSTAWGSSKTLTWTITSLGYGAGGTLYAGMGSETKITELNQSGTIEANTNGTYEVSYEDNQGNVATATIDVNDIDETEPVIDLVGTDDKIVWSIFDQVGQYENTVLTKYISSGVEVEVSIDGVTAGTEYSGYDISMTDAYTATASGKHTFTVTDAAGNESSASMNVYSVKIDDKTSYVVEGNKVDKPENPTKSGYTFVQWAESSDTETAFDFTEVIEKNTTIVSVWTLNAPTSASVNSPDAKVYGTEITLTATVGHAADTTPAYSYQWYKGDDAISGATNSTLTLKTVAQSGTYKVVVTAKDTDNLVSLETTSNAVVVSITKKELGIKLEVSDKIYDGDTSTTTTITLTGAEFEEAPEFDETTAKVVFVDEVVEVDKLVDVTGLVLTGAWGDNYTLKTSFDDVETTADITNATMLVSLPETRVVYTGSPYAPAISVTTVNNQTETITYSTTKVDYAGSVPTFTNEGTYTVYYKVTAANHTDIDTSFTYTIVQSTTELVEDVVSDQSEYTYGDTIVVTVTPKATGEEATSDAKVAGVMSVDLESHDANEIALYLKDVQLTDPQTVTTGTTLTFYIYTENRQLTIGDHTITAKYIGDDNMADVEGSVDITLNKKELSGDMIAAIDDQVYIGSELTPAIVVKDTSSKVTTGADIIKDTDYSDAVYTNNVNVADDTATVTITAEDIGYYTGKAEKTFNIVQSETYFGDEDLEVEDEDNVYTYGEIVTITVKPEATGVAVTMDALYPLEPSASQMALFAKDGTQLCEAVVANKDADENGYGATYTLTYDTVDKLLSVGTHSITAKFVGNTNMADFEDTFEITIEPKEIKAIWTDTDKVYTEAPLQPTITFVGLEEEDADDGVVTNIVAETEANTYTMEIELNTTNYVVSDNTKTGTFIISKAPVIFTLKTDASVSADKDVLYKVTYIDKNNVSYDQLPETNGTYTVYVKLTNENYRIAGMSTSEGAIGTYTVGSTVYTYTATFGDVEYTSLAGAMVIVPSSEEVNFVGWEYNSIVYKEGEIFTQPIKNIVFKMVTAEKIGISGAVTRVEVEGDEETTTPLEYAVVRLMLGSSKAAEDVITGNDGTYRFDGIVAGTYNVVVIYDGTTKTEIVTIVDESQTIDITMPEKQINSIVEVAAGTPDIVIGGLDKAAEMIANSEENENATSVELKLTVEEDTSTVSAEDQATIETKTSNVGLYLEITVEQTITEEGVEPEVELIRELDNLLQIIIPLPGALQGKASYTVYRVHEDGSGNTEVHTIATNPNDYDEYLELSADRTVLSLYVRKFSTYAIAYKEYTSGSDTRYIKVTTEGNGSVSPDGGADHMYPVEKYDDMTFEFEPDNGYVVADVLVDGKSVGNDDEYTFENILTGHTLEVIFELDEEVLEEELLEEELEALLEDVVLPFEDVLEDDWFYTSVAYVYGEGIMSGTSGTTFDPYIGTTRGMMAQVMYNIADGSAEDLENPFDDVTEDRWYHDAVVWSSNEGIYNGYGDGTFRGDLQITREQLMVIMYNFSKYQGNDVSAVGDVTIYDDYTTISGWALSSMIWAAGEDLICGAEDDLLHPKDIATRAEIAEVLYRLLEK